MLKSRYFKPQPMSSNVAPLSSLCPALTQGLSLGWGNALCRPKCELARAAPSPDQLQRPGAQIRPFVPEQKGLHSTEGCRTSITRSAFASENRPFPSQLHYPGATARQDEACSEKLQEERAALGVSLWVLVP